MPRVNVIFVCHVILISGIFNFIPAISVSGNFETSNQETKLHLLREQERQINTVVWLALIPVLLAFSFITFVFYRRKREAFFKQTEAELKIKALKAQINPHFIFNCMNSIHYYMHKSDIKKAGDYLITFSKLIRMVLENSPYSTITLKEDLRALTLYIQLEQIRLDNCFDFEIKVDDNVNEDECEIPGLLIQPFVENAIVHELSRVADQGHLSVSFKRHDEGILVTIKSSGTGQKQQPLNTALTEGITKTSMGLGLIRERLELINRNSSSKAYFNMQALSKAETNEYGFQVDLYIPVKD